MPGNADEEGVAADLGEDAHETCVPRVCDGRPDGGEALPEDEDLPITRYLVKWKQFSFLHVSWETKTDLESIDQKACQRAIMSLQGRERKGQVPEIGKPPCSKRAFDPQMVEVVRGGVLCHCERRRAIDAPRARVAPRVASPLR